MGGGLNFFSSKWRFYLGEGSGLKSKPNLKQHAPFLCRKSAYDASYLVSSRNINSFNNVRLFEFIGSLKTFSLQISGKNNQSLLKQECMHAWSASTTQLTQPLQVEVTQISQPDRPLLDTLIHCFLFFPAASYFSHSATKTIFKNQKPQRF